MPGTSGLDVASWMAANRPDTPVVVITAFGSLETAVAAIRAGAYDFVTKPFEIEAIGLSLGRAVGYRRLQAEVRRLRRAAGGDGADATATRLAGTALHGRSPAMLRTYDTIVRAAATDASILVTGESGTGKALVARALHDKGRRASGPFVAINCGALPESLLESELLGHARGSFTDARASRAGLLLRASGGTLFLDEIGEAPAGPAGQAPARARRASCPAGGRRRRMRVRRAHRLRNQSRSRGGDPKRALPVGSLLSDQTRSASIYPRCARAATTSSCWRRDWSSRSPGRPERA